MSTTAGIDIGSDAIKGVVLKAGKRGPVEVVAAGTMPIADLSRIPDSPDKTLAIGEKLKELVKSARLKAETRRLGASGGHTSIRYLQIPPVPPWRLEMLVKYEVEERNEEKENNAYDYHIMDVPETNGQYTVIVGTIEERFAKEMLNVAQQSGLGEVELDLEAMALFNAYYHGHGFDADKTVAIADIGTDDVTVLICRNGTLFYARTMMGGGKRFTQNLADDLKLDLNEAEELKKSTAEISFDVAPAGGAAGAAGASAINRAPRLTRPAGSISGARSAVNRAVPGAPVAGTLQDPGASAPGRVVAKAPGAAAFRAPGASAAAPVTNAAQATPPITASAGRPAVARTDEFTLDLLDLDALDAAPKAAPAVPAAVPAPEKKPQSDELELQLEDDKPQGPKAGEALGATQKLPAMSAIALEMSTKKPGGPGRPVPALVPVQAYAPALAAAADVPQTGSADAGFEASEAHDGSPVVLSNEERERRKRQMSAALVREAASLCAAIENVLMTCKAQSKQQLKLDRLYITGGASKLKGLKEFMGRRLRVEVQYLEPLRNLSLERLKPEAREALKSEQHTLHTALGLALSDLRPGAQSFLIWPNAVKQRKVFWARGAYLYYAAGAAAIAMGVMLYTPNRNTEKLVANNAEATKAVQKADSENNEAAKMKKDNDELRHRLKTITDNVQSGDYFLNVLAELKSKLRIRDDIYLTSVSTSIPNVVIVESDQDTKLNSDGLVVPKNTTEIKALLLKAAELTRGEPSSFQAQRRVYVRGIARGPRKDGLIELIQDFYNRLVPFPNEPDNPQNLFKDIRPVWYSKEDNKQGNYYLKEFVLEAYTEKPPVQVAAGAKKGGKDKTGKTLGATPAAPVTPPALPAQPTAVLGTPMRRLKAEPPPLVEVPIQQPEVPQLPPQANVAQPPGVPVPQIPAGKQPDTLLPYLKNMFQNDPKANVPTTVPPPLVVPQPAQLNSGMQPVPPVPLPIVPEQPKVKHVRQFVTPDAPAPVPVPAAPGQ